MNDEDLVIKLPVEKIVEFPQDSEIKNEREKPFLLVRFTEVYLRANLRAEVTPVPYQPLNEWVLIEKIEDGESVTKGGIVIPDQFKTKSNKGVVVAVGEGRVIGSQIVPIPLVAGDIVLFAKFGGQEIKLEV